MDLHTVFAHKLQDLARRSNGIFTAGEDPQYGTLMAAPLLREILFGVPPLAHRVVPEGVKLTFECCPLQHVRPVHLASMGDQFDPHGPRQVDDQPHGITMQIGATYMAPYVVDERGVPPRTPKPVPTKLRLKPFLKAPVASYDGTDLSVKDLIDYAANAGGGVHFASVDKHERARVEALNATMQMAGMEAGLHLLQAVGRVTVAALERFVTV